MEANWWSPSSQPIQYMTRSQWRVSIALLALWIALVWIWEYRHPSPPRYVRRGGGRAR